MDKDEDTAYGLTFPDFEGCFSAADEMQDIQRMAQEAVELHFDGEDLKLPKPSSPELNRIEMLWRSMKYQWREFKFICYF